MIGDAIRYQEELLQIIDAGLITNYTKLKGLVGNRDE